MTYIIPSTTKFGDTVQALRLCDAIANHENPENIDRRVSRMVCKFNIRWKEMQRDWVTYAKTRSPIYRSMDVNRILRLSIMYALQGLYLERDAAVANALIDLYKRRVIDSTNKKFIDNDRIT